MNIHHLELFYYVACHGGISEAVRHMPYGIQQPAVSDQVIQLEEFLGVTLFHGPVEIWKTAQELWFVPSKLHWLRYPFLETFFGKPAYTMTLALKLAQRPNAVCLLAWGERLPGGGGYVIHIRPMLVAEPGESEARRLNRAIEALLGR